MLALLMMLFSVVCQSQQCSVIKKLDDGSWAVDCGEPEKRLAITKLQLDSWAKLQIDFDASQKEKIELNKQIGVLTQQKELLQKDVTIADQQRDSALKDLTRSQEDTSRAQEDAKRNFGLLIGERQLRIEAQQFIPHGEVKGFGGTILKFLDGPYGQSAFKLVIPAATFIKTMNQGCAIK